MILALSLGDGSTEQPARILSTGHVHLAMRAAVVCRPQKRLGVKEEFPLPICNFSAVTASELYSIECIVTCMS